jgi:hypothetical protein
MSVLSGIIGWLWGDDRRRFADLAGRLVAATDRDVLALQGYSSAQSPGFFTQYLQFVALNSAV